MRVPGNHPAKMLILRAENHQFLAHTGHLCTPRHGQIQEATTQKNSWPLMRANSAAADYAHFLGCEQKGYLPTGCQGIWAIATAPFSRDDPWLWVKSKDLV